MKKKKRIRKISKKKATQIKAKFFLKITKILKWIKKASKIPRLSPKKITLKKANYKKARPASKKALLKKADSNSLKYPKISRAEFLKKSPPKCLSPKSLRAFLLKISRCKGKKKKIFNSKKKNKII